LLRRTSSASPEEFFSVRHYHAETHFSKRIGWLRAAVLGANDGIISTASLVMGVAAADATSESILIAGVAGLAAGAMSMAAGEYVSVSSQADTERADLARERKELEMNPEFEHRELSRIYVDRGLDATLADQVAQQLMKHDALGAHARDELGLSSMHAARPVQAALASAATFSIGAALPLLTVTIAPSNHVLAAVGGSTLLSLTILGYLAAYAGGANVYVSTARIIFWGAAAMAITVAVGKLFGAVI
jgi:vacuolar iron transporter family protein